MEAQLIYLWVSKINIGVFMDQVLFLLAFGLYLTRIFNFIFSLLFDGS